MATEHDPVARAQRFREQLGEAATSLSDEEFEEFLGHLGGGLKADVEDDRAQAVSRLSHTTRGIEEYFAIAAAELSTLEQRGYNPDRPDVKRQLRDNKLPLTTVADYRRELHELGIRVGQKA